MADQKQVPGHFNTLTDYVRYRTRNITSWLGSRAYRLGIHPDMVTLVGVLIVAVSAYLIAQGNLRLALIIMLLGAPLDALDGAIARAMQRESKFGALFDSTLDRYSDGFIFMGFAYYESYWGNETGVVVSIMALLGSLLVSYVRARAEGLDVDCKVGLLTRMERMIIIMLTLLTGWVSAGMWILAIGTHFTVLQRVLYVRRELAKREVE